MISCLLLDDEPLALEVLQNHLSRFADWEVIGAYSDPVVALQAIGQQRPDVLFLDIEMPLFTGFDLLRSLPYRPLVVLVTAYRQYAVESYEVEAFDYLVKPVSLPRFARTLAKAAEALQLAPPRPASELAKQPVQSLQPVLLAPPELWLKVDKKLVRVVLADIYHVESLKDYVRVHASSGKLVTHGTLQAMIAQLSAHDFMQIHKSYVVSLRHVQALEGNLVQAGGQLLPIGRSFRAELLRRLTPFATSSES